MADKIRVVKSDGSIVEVDLDKFYKDYRKETFASGSSGSVISPTEFFWKWVEEQK